MNAADIPAHLKQIIDNAAGHIHTATGTVMTTLAEILTAHEAHMNAAALATVTNDELIAEMSRRHITPRCPCGKWASYVGAYDHEGYTWRCRGCIRSIHSCRC